MDSNGCAQLLQSGLLRVTLPDLREAWTCYHLLCCHNLCCVHNTTILTAGIMTDTADQDEEDSHY